MLTKEDIKREKAVSVDRFNKKGKEYTPAGIKRIKQLRKLFEPLVEKTTPQQIDLVNWYTQKDCIMSPSELNKLFHSLNQLT